VIECLLLIFLFCSANVWWIEDWYTNTLGLLLVLDLLQIFISFFEAYMYVGLWDLLRSLSNQLHPKPMRANWSGKWQRVFPLFGTALVHNRPLDILNWLDGLLRWTAPTHANTLLAVVRRIIVRQPLSVNEWILYVDVRGLNKVCVKVDVRYITSSEALKCPIRKCC